MDDNSDDEPILISSAASSEKSEQIRNLSHRLLQESLTRQEIDELYHKLQSEYDTLLTKHALAENTIDQLRIGARVNLYSDGPTPHQAQQLKVTEIKPNPQPISLPSKERAVIGIPNLLSKSTCTNDSYPKKANSAEPNDQAPYSDVLHRLKDLQNDIAAFQSAVAYRELSFEEQKNLYNALKEKHDGLKDELEKMKEDGQAVRANSAQRPNGHSFHDPSSLEGELYRLELRLAEVCEDIGDQLYSNRENDSPLEQALRDDFQRMRLSSLASARSRSPSGHQLAGNFRTEHQSKPKLERTSRSNSDLSVPARNRTLSKDGEGSLSNHDKGEMLSPSNEDQAESGYYASESIIRESPKREIASNVPIRYLTRSRSPKEKGANGRSLRRHWSLSAYNSQSESIEEVTLTDEEVDFVDSRKPKSDGIGNVGHLKKQIKDNDYREHPPNRSSTHLPNDGNRIAPAATSSPYEERSLQELSLPPQEVSSQTEQGDEISTHRKRAKKSTRATPSDRSVLEGRSDGRRSSVKSASRLSRTRPKQYNYSSSEESYPAHRPERLNSSVYSEQDKVPSLVNLPKSNAFLSRHRPNTAESNLDSGFVGSEGTLKSQDLSNSVNHARPRPSRRGPVTKPDAGKEQPTGTKFNGSSPYPEIANDAVEGRSKERQRHPSTRETPVDRMSASVGNPRMQSRDKNIPESHETSRISSKLNQPFTRVQEVGRRTSTLDDITSVHTSPETQTDASFRRLPVTTERSPFDSSVPVIDLEDSPVKRVRQPRDAERYRRSTLSPISKGSDPQRLVLHSKGDRRSWRSDSRRHLISSATSGDRLPAGGLHSYDEDSISDKAIEPRKQKRERIPPRFNESSHSTNGSRPSEYADRLHKDLQLLRDQLSRLNQTHIQDNHAKRLRNTNEHIVSPAITGDRTYDDIKQKLDGLNGQLQKSLHQLKERSSPERGYKPNRDYQELKDKIDQLTVELQRTQEYVFDSKESLDQFATPPSRSLPGFRRSQPATQEQLFTLQGPTQEHFDTDQYSRPIYTKQPKPSRTYVDPQELQAMPLRSSHTQPAVMESSPTYITVCPVCSDIGYHKHGDYVFQGRPVPMHQTAFQTSLSPAKVVASTPNRPVQNMHPLDFSPTHQMPSTIHHIHTIHKSRKSTVMSSSSESQSDNEEDRRRKRRRNRSSNVSNRARSASKARDRLANRRLDEFNDWRLSESLDEAARAASNMQIASRRMLNSLAADLIKSGYS